MGVGGPNGPNGPNIPNQTTSLESSTKKFKSLLLLIFFRHVQTKTAPQTSSEVGRARERQMDTSATPALTKTVAQTNTNLARAAGLPMGMLGTILCAVCYPQGPQDCNLSTLSFDLVSLV